MWGVTMLMLNIGSRYVVADLGKFHESVLSNEYVKKLIVFSMFFVATRDVLTAFLLTVLYILLIDGIFHEKRKFCIVPKKYRGTTAGITEADYQEAKKTINLYEAGAKTTTAEDSRDDLEYTRYVNNIKLLNSKMI